MRIDNPFLICCRVTCELREFGADLETLTKHVLSVDITDKRKRRKRARFALGNSGSSAASRECKMCSSIFMKGARGFIIPCTRLCFRRIWTHFEAAKMGGRAWPNSSCEFSSHSARKKKRECFSCLRMLFPRGKIFRASVTLLCLCLWKKKNSYVTKRNFRKFLTNSNYHLASNSKNRKNQYTI